jgi:hypothetical protein
MKIAFCIHGLVGSKQVKYGSVDKNQNIESKIPYKHFKKNIFDLYKGKIDIFLHTQSHESKSELLKLYKPKLYKIEKKKDFSYSKNHPHLKNIKFLKFKNYIQKIIGLKSAEKKYDYLIKKAFASYSRWYSLRESIKLKKKYEVLKDFKYDLVFITRYDLIIKKKFNLHEFDTKKLTISNHNTIPSPRNSYKIKSSRDNKTKTKGISDLWFASSSNNIDKFSLLFERIRKYPLSNHFSSYYHTQHINLDLDFKYYRYFDFELLRRIKKSKE